jgi:hypothetical protein
MSTWTIGILSLNEGSHFIFFCTYVNISCCIHTQELISSLNCVVNITKTHLGLDCTYKSSFSSSSDDAKGVDGDQEKAREGEKLRWRLCEQVEACEEQTTTTVDTQKVEV